VEFTHTRARSRRRRERRKVKRSGAVHDGRAGQIRPNTDFAAYQGDRTIADTKQYEIGSGLRFTYFLRGSIQLSGEASSGIPITSRNSGDLDAA
jgi:hypothetical protein